MSELKELLEIQKQIFALHEKASRKASGFVSFFGTKVKIERDKINITQKQLSDLSGISRTQLANVERGGSSTSIINFIRICTALNKTPNEMLGYE